MKKNEDKELESIVVGGMKTIENALIVICSILTVGFILLIALTML